MRWKSSATVAMALMSLVATASRAQTTSFTGCHLLPGMLVLPSGLIYYTQTPYGPAMLGMCDPWGNVVPVTYGWGNQTYTPNFGTGWTGSGGSTSTTPNDQGSNNQGTSNDQGDNDQGDSNDQPQYTPTNDSPPNNSEIPQNNVPPLETTTTPEPGSVILVGSGLVALAARKARRRKRATS